MGFNILSRLYNKLALVRMRGIKYYVDPVLWFMLRLNLGIIIFIKLMVMAWGLKIQ